MKIGREIPGFEANSLGGKGGMVVRLRHHGVHDGVKGSCHERMLDGRKSMLVDCRHCVLFVTLDGTHGWAEYG